MKFSKRATQLKGSATMAATLRAQEKIKNGEDIVLASVGEPDAPSPEITKTALIERIDNIDSKYGPAQGLLSTRKVISQWMNQLYDQKWTEEQVILSPGSKYSLYALFQVLCDEEDEVLIPSPYWVSYVTLAKFSNAQVKIIDCGKEQNYKLTAKDLERNITSKTKVLLLNSPQNPTGAVYSLEELKTLSAILEKHPHVFVICDDIYNQLVFSKEKRCPHLLDVFPHDSKDQVIVVHGASKSFALTGWRLGWIMGAKELIQKLSEFQSQTLTCMPDFLQIALEKTLTDEKFFVDNLKKQIQKRYEYAFSELQNCKGIKVFKSEGAFYVWMEVLDKSKSSVKICEELLAEQGLALVPGASFGCEYHLRFSVTIADEKLKDGLARLKKYFHGL